jgi:hypothetical protein
LKSKNLEWAKNTIKFKIIHHDIRTPITKRIMIVEFKCIYSVRAQKTSNVLKLYILSKKVKAIAVFLN